MEIRLISEEELKNNIINKKDFPDAIFMNSSDFFKNLKRYVVFSRWFGLFIEGALVCVASVKDKGEKNLFLELLETKRGNRQKGYASKLLEHLESLYNKDFSKVSLMVVNKEKIKFYEDRGFKVVDTDEYKTTVNMEKMLSKV